MVENVDIIKKRFSNQRNEIKGKKNAYLSVIFNLW